MLGGVTDPLPPIFGLSTPAIFESRELLVRHGALERFPAFMHTGPLTSVDDLSRNYTGGLEVANGSVADGIQTAVSGVHPSALLRLGLTVYFSDLRRVVPKSNAWLRSLEQSLGLPECASILAFANAPGSGLPLHHDRYDQLFFQIRGEKRFRYAANEYVTNPDVQFSPHAAAHPDFAANYRHGFPLTSAEVLSKSFQSVDLLPGSAFFMPAGTWHTTAEQAGESLSLVVAIRAPSRLDVFQNFLHYYASQSPEWRARGYGGWSSEPAVALEAQAKLASLLDDLSKRLLSLRPDDAFKAWPIHGYTVGTQAEYPAELRFERFIRLPNSSLRFEEDAALGKLRCIVKSGPSNRPQAETVLAIEHHARKVVDWILASHAAFSVEELCAALPEFDGEEVRDLLGYLSQAALIRPLPAPEW